MCVCVCVCVCVCMCVCVCVYGCILAVLCGNKVNKILSSQGPFPLCHLVDKASIEPIHIISERISARL